MALSTLAPLCVLAAFGLQQVVTTERNVRLERVEETARATALLLDRDIAEAAARVRVLAQSAELMRGDLAGFHRLSSSAVPNPPSRRILLSDAQGTALANTLVPYGSPLPRAPGGWVRDVFATTGVRVSGVFLGQLAGRSSVSVDVAGPRGPDGGRLVVSEVIDAQSLAHIFATSRFGKDWTVALVDAAGKVVARNRHAHTYVGHDVPKPLMDSIRQGVKEPRTYITLEGQEVVGVLATAPLAGWTVAIGVPADEIEWPAVQAALFALAVIVGVGLFAFGTATLLARRVRLAVQDAGRTASALVAGNAAPPAPTAVRELDEILSDLYRLAAWLDRESMARRGLEQEREGLLQAEQAARLKAEQQNAAKDEFVAMLGHELRNPLAAIAAAVDILRLDQASEAQRIRAREICSRQLDHLRHILDELLDAERILRGKITLSLDQLDLGALLKSALDSAVVVDCGRHQWQFSAEPVVLRGDRARLTQVFDNLLHNARKFTPEGGEIRVACRRSGAWAVITVEDSGVGLAAADLERVFGMLVQVRSGHVAPSQGLGIGLALVRGMVELHGGSVSAASQGAGRGATFTVRLPADA